MDRLGAMAVFAQVVEAESFSAAGPARGAPQTFSAGGQRVVAEAAAAESAVTHLGAAPRGRLTISVPMSFGLRHVGPVLPLLLDRCPELTIDLSLNDRFIDLVE